MAYRCAIEPGQEHPMSVFVPARGLYCKYSTVHSTTVLLEPVRACTQTSQCSCVFVQCSVGTQLGPEKVLNLLFMCDVKEVRFYLCESVTENIFKTLLDI